MGTCNPATGTCTCNAGCFGDDCSNICTTNNCCGLTSIKTLTRSTPSWAKMDATLKFQICHGELGNCCWTDELDDTNKNDFELGNIFLFYNKFELCIFTVLNKMMRLEIFNERLARH